MKKYYKPITVQHYRAGCVSWVRRLTLLNLRTNWTSNVLSGWNSFVCRGLTVFCLPWWTTHVFGAHWGYILLIPKVFAELQAISKQRSRVTVAFLHGWPLEPRSLFCSSASTQLMFPKKCWFYLFPNWKCIFKPFRSGKWEPSICFGHSGDELQVLACLVSEAFLFATIRFYDHPILIQGQN